MQNQDIKSYFNKYLTPPGGYENLIEAKLKNISGRPLHDDDVITVVTTSSYFAAVLRTAYKRFVKEQGISPEDYWDTVTEVFIRSGLWSETWRKVLKSPKGLSLIKETTLPAWTPIGLSGTNWRTLYQMLEIWSSRVHLQTEAG